MKVIKRINRLKQGYMDERMASINDHLIGHAVIIIPITANLI